MTEESPALLLAEHAAECGDREHCEMCAALMEAAIADGDSIDEEPDDDDWVSRWLAEEVGGES